MLRERRSIRRLQYGDVGQVNPCVANHQFSFHKNGQTPIVSCDDDPHLIPCFEHRAVNQCGGKFPTGCFGFGSWILMPDRSLEVKARAVQFPVQMRFNATVSPGW